MGEVVRFPGDQWPRRYTIDHVEPAEVIILPVVRIERDVEVDRSSGEEPIRAPGRKRRRTSVPKAQTTTPQESSFAQMLLADVFIFPESG